MNEPLIHEGAAVFSMMAFKEIHTLRLNTEADALHDGALIIIRTRRTYVRQTFTK